MCLDTVKDKALRTTGLIQSGWKFFNKTSWPERLEFQAFAYNGKREVPLDKWITAEETTVYVHGSAPGSGYKAGFHIYEDETEFKQGVSDKRRVYYRGVHTRGSQDNKTVVIAKQMYVPSDPDAWPPK